MSEKPVWKATFISSISKFSGERSGRIGINIPAALKDQFPIGIRVKVTLEEIKEGVEGAQQETTTTETAGINIE